MGVQKPPAGHLGTLKRRGISSPAPDCTSVAVWMTRMDIREILEDDEYAVILKRLQKGILKVPVVFVPHR